MGFRALLVVLVLALLVPARLHALVAADTGMRHEIAAPDAHHHGDHAHQPPKEHAPPTERDRHANHAQCLTACLVIPVPQAVLEAPPEVFRRVTGAVASRWPDGLTPPRLERPPRALS